MNYFEERINQVSDLRHFPFNNIEDFKQAVRNGTVKAIGVQMDYARDWVTTSKDSPRPWNMIYILFSGWILFVLFYIISAIVLHNYFLLPLAILPVLVLFFSNPIAERMVGSFLKLLFLIIFLIVWFISKHFPELIYWFPLVLQYILLKQAYVGSAGIVRKEMLKKESVLCLFWKYFRTDIVFENGDIYQQWYFQHNGKTEYYSDIQQEWDNYVKEKDGTKVSDSSQADTKIQSAPVKSGNYCTNCGFSKNAAANYCKNCGSTFSK